MTAPIWLREGFAAGVDERETRGVAGMSVRFYPRFAPYPGAYPACFLAQHDPRRRPCEGRIERFHFVGRQRARHALALLLPNRQELFAQIGELVALGLDVIPLAEWDPRAGGLGCEGHHRRFDSHATPALIVPHHALPDHVIEWSIDYGLEAELERKCPPPGC